jgi:hypothetical protein
MVRLRALAWLTGSLMAASLLLPPANPAHGFQEGPARMEIDRLVPADAGFLVAINVRKILDAPLVKKDAQKGLEKALAKDEELAKILKESGFDPLKDLDSITVTGPLDLMSFKGFAVVRGRFQPDKILAAAATAAKQHPDKLKMVKEGNLEIVQIQGDRPAYAAFADNRTLIISAEKSVTAEVVQRAAKPAGRPNKALLGALSKLTGKEVIALAVPIPDQFKDAIKEQNKEAAELVSSMEAITGGIELTDGVKMALVIHTTDEAGATLIRKKIEDVLPALNFVAGQDNAPKGLKEALESLKITSDKSSVTISLHLSEEMLKKAAEKDK